MKKLILISLILVLLLPVAEVLCQESPLVWTGEYICEPGYDCPTWEPPTHIINRPAHKETRRELPPECVEPDGYICLVP